MAKPGQVEQQWYVVDASDEVLGRLASDIAVVLMGKHRPHYTPHVDCGDFVIVVNAEKVGMTGKKMDDRHYTWYTGYPGLRLESYGAWGETVIRLAGSARNVRCISSVAASGSQLRSSDSGHFRRWGVWDPTPGHNTPKPKNATA